MIRVTVDSSLEIQVGQKTRTLVYGSPPSHPSHINVHETRIGVIAYSASMQGYGCISNFRRGKAGHANIDRLGLNVLAVQRNRMAMVPQPLVGLQGTIAANDVDLAIGSPQAHHEIVEQVELTQVVVADIACSIIAQNVIELDNGRNLIPIADSIHRVQVFAGMQVVKVKPVFRGSAARSLNPAPHQEQHNGCNPELQKLPEGHSAILPGEERTYNKPASENNLDRLLRPLASTALPTRRLKSTASPFPGEIPMENDYPLHCYFVILIENEQPGVNSIRRRIFLHGGAGPIRRRAGHCLSAPPAVVSRITAGRLRLRP